jgi:hypothetical protein
MTATEPCQPGEHDLRASRFAAYFLCIKCCHHIPREMEAQAAAARMAWQEDEARERQAWADREEAMDPHNFADAVLRAQSELGSLVR